MADYTFMPRVQDYVFSSPLPPTIPVDTFTASSSTTTNYIRYVDVKLHMSDGLTDLQLEVAPLVSIGLNERLQVEFGGKRYELKQGDPVRVVVDAPFTDPVGVIKCRLMNVTTGVAWQWTTITPAPFLVPNTTPRWGRLVRNYTGFFGTTDLFHGYVTGANRSFGFAYPVDHLRYEVGWRAYFGAPLTGGNPDLFVNLPKDEPVFLADLFCMNSSSRGGEFGIRCSVVDTSGNTSQYETIRFYSHYSSATQRENTQNITIGESAVTSFIVGGTRRRNIFNPVGFKVEVKTSPDYLIVDHYEIDFQGTVLTNYMFPSSVLMPDSTWRLLAYNRTERRYDIFSTTVGSTEGGFMKTVWGTGYHAAHLTRLLDGTLCSMAWTYDPSDTKYRLWFKRSSDDGATWGSEILIDTFSSTVPFAKTFNPSWVIVQNYRTGTIVVGDYFSDDMGNTWRITT